MALITAGVGVHRPGMGIDDVGGPVAGRTITVRGMVIVMACDAGLHLRSSLQTHRRHVALYAGDLWMVRMIEGHRPSSGFVLRDLDPDRHSTPSGQLVLPVTGGAITSTGPLMMTDLTAARRREGQRAGG